jgi:hypothetical protein
MQLIELPDDGIALICNHLNVDNVLALRLVSKRLHGSINEITFLKVRITCFQY